MMYIPMEAFLMNLAQIWAYVFSLLNLEKVYQTGFDSIFERYKHLCQCFVIANYCHLGHNPILLISVILKACRCMLYG